MKKQMEGNEKQRRQAAREAREQGKTASEMGATLGASKQRREVKGKASHQDKLEARDHGKQQKRNTNEPRPGNRERDPRRGD